MCFWTSSPVQRVNVGLSSHFFFLGWFPRGGWCDRKFFFPNPNQMFGVHFGGGDPSFFFWFGFSTPPALGVGLFRGLYLPLLGSRQPTWGFREGGLFWVPTPMGAFLGFGLWGGGGLVPKNLFFFNFSFPNHLFPIFPPGGSFFFSPQPLVARRVLSGGWGTLIW